MNMSQELDEIELSPALSQEDRRKPTNDNNDIVILEEVNEPREQNMLGVEIVVSDAEEDEPDEVTEKLARTLKEDHEQNKNDPFPEEHRLDREISMAPFFKRLFYRLISSPELRQDWDEQQLVEPVDWWEIFFDLMFVGCFFQLSQYLKASMHDRPGAAIGLVWYYTTALAFAWGDVTFYFTRFRSNGDLFTSSALALFALSILGMGVFLNEGLDLRRGFAWSAVLSRMSWALLYAPVWLLSPLARPRPLGRIVVLISLFQALLWTLTAVLDSVVLFLLNGTVFWFVQVMLPGQFKATRLPLNIGHMGERMGNFVSLLLGESVLGLVTLAFPQDPEHQHKHVQGVILAFGIIFTAKLHYFDCQPHYAEEHAMRHKRLTGRMYLWSHFLLVASPLVSLGTAIKQVISHIHETHVDFADLILLSESYTSVLIVFNFIRLLHPFKKRSLRVWIARCIIIVTPAVFLPLHGTSLTGIQLLVILFFEGATLSVIDALGYDVPLHRVMRHRMFWSRHPEKQQQAQQFIEIMRNRARLRRLQTQQEHERYLFNI